MTWTVRGLLRGRAARLLLLAALVLRLAYGAWAVLPYRDGVIYDETARNMLAHGAYRASEPERSPGYPFFLVSVYALFGERHEAVRVVQALLDLASAVLALGIARRLGLSARAALIAFAIALFNPSTFVYSAMILSESLATCLITAGLWLLLEATERGGRWAFGFGAALSAAALTRPSFALLPGLLLIVAAAGRLMDGRRWVRVAALAVAGFVVVWLPWGIRNAVHYGALVPYHRFESPSPGYHLWVTTWAWHLHDEYAAYLDASVEPPARAFRNDAERAALEPLVRERRYGEADARFGAIAAERIAASPLTFYVVNPVIRCATMWLTPPSTLLAQMNVPFARLGEKFFTRPFAVTAKLVLTAFTFAFPLAALLGWWQLRRRQGAAADLPLAVAAYATLIIQAVMLLEPQRLVLMEPRYLVESFTGLAPMVAVGVMALLPQAATRDVPIMVGSAPAPRGSQSPVAS